MPLITRKVAKLIRRKQDIRPGEKDIVDHSESLFQDETTLTVVYSQKWKGISISGKPWSRWQFTGYSQLTREPDGRITAIDRLRRPMGRGWFSTLSGYWRAASQYPDQVTAFGGAKDQFELYRYNKSAVAPRPIKLQRAYQTDDVKKALSEIFGKAHYRRTMVPLIESHLPSTLFTFSHWAGRVPIDHLIGFLKPQIAGFADFYPSRRFMRSIPAPVTLRLLRSDDYDTHLLEDVYRWTCGNPLPPALPWDRIRNWQQLHDVTVARARVTRVNLPIPPTAQSKALHLLETPGGLRIQTPQETRDLELWGNMTGTCIAGYDYIAMSGTSSLGSVWRDDELVALFEIQSGHIRQLVGRFNAPLPPDLDADIRSTITPHLQPLAIPA